jgi:hypothetical protein
VGKDYSDACTHEIYVDGIDLYPSPGPNDEPVDWFDHFDYDELFAGYDTIASSYVMGDDWVGIDPYIYPLYPRNDTYYSH